MPQPKRRYELDWSDRLEPYASGLALGADAVGLGAAFTGIGAPTGALIAGLGNIPNAAIDVYQTLRDWYRYGTNKGDYESNLGSAIWNTGETALDLLGMKYALKGAKFVNDKLFADEIAGRIADETRRRAGQRFILRKKGMTDEEIAKYITQKATNAVMNTKDIQARKKDYESNTIRQARIATAIANAPINIQHILEQKPSSTQVYNPYRRQFLTGGKTKRRTLEDGKLSDEDYYRIMERVAKENYKAWGLPDEDTALLHAINDNTYIPARWQRRRYLDGGGKKLELKRDKRYYIVQKGDTLGAISKKFSGKSKDYLQIANLNNIENPDLITVGQKLEIPEKFDKPLTFEQLPTNNRISIIDDYSPNYNYIIEGNKIYYSRKGHNDYWVDISDNEVARKNLFTHIADKYNYKGYEDNEREIGEKIKNNTYNYKEAIRPKRKFRLDFENPIMERNIEVPSSTYVKKLDYSQNQMPREATTYLGDAVTAIIDLYQKGTNYISRQYEKLIGDNDSSSVLTMPQQTETDSKFAIMPESYTGDTINIDKNKYIIPESINLNDVRLGIRNRGSREPINTEGAIITNFNPYISYDKVNKNDKTATYMGIDKNGNFKVGNIDSFAEGDMLTRTYANDVESFAKDKQGNQLWKDDAVHGNRGRNVPIINVVENGKVKQGSLNILSNKGSKDNNTYGNITGGRVILEAGNERRLVSGSIADIEKQFNDLKQRHGVNTVRIYTLDNGSYNRGLRTKNKVLTKADLQAYDNQNSGGGNFMYILNSPQFTEDTVKTPNIRTSKDESYKKGHPLINEKKGVVLHHTAFEEDDLTNVTKHLTDPKSEASSHVIIGYDGHRRNLATADDVTFHAGYSVWNNRQDVNDFMLGIEFQGDTNKKDLTNAQIKSAVEYLKPLVRKNNIPLENIVTHEQVRAMYNDFARKQGKKIAPNKPDINKTNYEKIIKELLKSLYYEKPKRSIEAAGKRQ